MSTLKTDNISPNGSTVNVTSGLNVQGGATLAAATITGNLNVDGNVFGVNATTNTVTVSSPANTTPVLLLGVSANAGTTHRSIFRFGHDQNSSSIPVGEIHGVVDNVAGASQRAGHIEFSTANAGVTAERMRIESTGKIVVNNARGDVGAGAVLTGQNALGTIHFVQNTTNDNWVGMTTSATTTPTTSQGGILIQGSGGYGTKIHFLTTEAYSDGQKNRMTIDHVGRVGIGTAAPQVPLDVRGGSVRVDSSGSFEQSVAISSPGAWARGLFFYDSRATTSLNSVGVTGAVGMYGNSASPSSIFIGHGDTPWSGTNSIHLLTNGNVGIGITAPAFKLDVSGGVKATSLALTGKATSASTASADGGTTLVTKDYVDSGIGTVSIITMNGADLDAGGTALSSFTAAASSSTDNISSGNNDTNFAGFKTGVTNSAGMPIPSDATGNTATIKYANSKGSTQWAVNGTAGSRKLVPDQGTWTVMAYVGKSQGSVIPVHAIFIAIRTA